jgi:hypothetical protein
MLCESCAKLALILKIKYCFRCRKEIKYNLYVICENCSNNNRICGICLKKISKPNKRICDTCGKKS